MFRFSLVPPPRAWVYPASPAGAAWEGQIKTTEIVPNSSANICPHPSWVWSRRRKSRIFSGLSHTSECSMFNFRTFSQKTKPSSFRFRFISSGISERGNLVVVLTPGQEECSRKDLQRVGGTHRSKNMALSADSSPSSGSSSSSLLPSQTPVAKPLFCPHVHTYAPFFPSLDHLIHAS